MVKVSQVNSNFIDLDVNVDVEVLIELYSTPDISKAGEKNSIHSVYYYGPKSTGSHTSET